MPRQIPLRRARGGGGELDGCGELYLRFIVAFIVLILVGTFCRTVIESLSVIMPVVFIVIGIVLIVFAYERRYQVVSWLVSMENQIEQWSNERFVLVVASLIAIAFCLILFVVIWGFTSL